MLTARRLSRKAAIPLVLLAVLVGVLHGSAPRGSAPHGRPVTTSGSGRPVAARTLSATTAASPATGGPCSVPGIGDIGGLLGFCSLGSSGLVGSLNGLCNPGPPEPESATSGVDSLISPPAPPGKMLATPYNEYGMSGQYWAPTDLQCSDMTSLIGNDVAGMLFDFAKALDRVTITVYQSAAGEGILGWLQGVTDKLITGLGNAIYFPYVALVVILGAIWLAWQALIRKRATRSIEGTIWMVMACVAAIWLIGRPADFTGVGKGVTDGISVALNTAFAHLPTPGQATCLPVKANDPQISPVSFAYTSGRTVVDQNANELWTVLVCKPWLDGEFGTTAYTANGKPTALSTYGRQLLWAQAIAVNEKPTTTLITAKQASYLGIARSIQSTNPAVYPLFQGKEWTTRLEIAFLALLAAVVAGVLILLISVTLILLKLGFLLLLIVGPFFLLIGTHPGFGRVVAIRWFEMLVGVLLKQAAVALALSVLLYCYALIMGTPDAVLSWALKILMITLVTVAVFIYRKPFQHLFSAVGYGVIGSADRAEADLSRAAATARANTASAATFVPGFAAYRAARWARRNPAQAAGLALGATTAVSAATVAAGVAAADGGAGGGDGSGSGTLDPAAAGAAAGVGARARAYGASTSASAGGEAPPLRLPSSAPAPVSWTKSGASAGSSARPGGGPGLSGGSTVPPPSARSSAAQGGSARSAGPSAWSGRSAPRSLRQAPPARQNGAPRSPGAAGSSGSGSYSGASRPADAGGRGPTTRPARPARATGQGRPAQDGRSAPRTGGGRPGRSGGGSARGGGPSSAADEGSSPDGTFSAAPYGLGSGPSSERTGPFWSRPVWRRK
jgi:hypothetical protein